MAKSPLTPIHINPAHKGSFTQKAKAHGDTVAQYATKVLANPAAPKELREQAQFAKNAEGWSKKK